MLRGEGEAKIERGHHRCLQCGRGTFPLDRRLHLTRHFLTPATITQALRMSVEMPSNGRAVAQFSELIHVGMSKSSLQELVKAYGGQLVECQAEEAQASVEMSSKEEEEARREIPEPPSETMK